MMSVVEQGLVRGKVTRPRTRDALESRARIDEEILGLLREHRIVVVTATAGSGKTTAVAHALAAAEQPVAWLTLDRSDVSAGRLLSYLEEAVRAALPGTGPVATRALAAGIGHPDASALLAESVGDERLVMVLDELEHIAEAPSALEAVTSFLRYLPEQARVVLVSRRDVPLELAREDLDGEVGRVGERDLALTVDEARRLLDSTERHDVDATAAVEATAGWMTGVQFEAWRSARHVFGTGGEADPLRTYLSSEIMSALPQAAQTFLIETSVLDEVTASRAEALGLGDTAATLALLHQRHLPVEFLDAHTMRCHPRLREYLVERLEGLEPSVVRGIRAAYADLLVEEGREEDAVGEYLRAGDVAQAEDVAAVVILDVVRRLDIDLARRWLDSFRRWRIESSRVLTEAELLVALEYEAYGEGVRCADRLLRIARAEGMRAIEPGMFGAMAWCYCLTGRVEDAERLLAEAEPGAETTMMRFVIGVELVDSPVHYRDRPADTDTHVDGMLARIDLAHGRFQRVLGARTTRYDAVRTAQLGALTGLGRLEDARTQLEASRAGLGWTHVRMVVELLAECGRPEEAWATLIRGRELLTRNDSALYRILASLTEVMLVLRFSRDTALASALLEAVEQEPTALRRVRVLEQLALWRGLIALIDGDDAAAVERLREAVDLMTTWDRLLLLPVAAVYLAEAEWRVQDYDAADAATDLALRSAERTGSRHAMIGALRTFPAVLSRRLDAETDPDSAWHDLGRAVLAAAAGPAQIAAVSARVSEFGEPAIQVEDRRYRLKLTKSAELLAYLASRGGRATREDVLVSLFESKNDSAAQAYLRMAVGGVRASFPDGNPISTEDGAITWTAGTLESDFTVLRTRLIRLRNVQGRQRLALAMDALTGIPEGEYVPGAKSSWVVDQRRRWRDLVLDVRHVAAEAAFEVADYVTCSILVGHVLDSDPYRERAWRLKMRVAGAVGDSDGVVAAFRACEDAMASISIPPAESTRRLLHQLHF